MSETTLVRRGDVIIANMADSRGREIRKARPYVVVSPDDLNSVASTYIVAPLTTGHHPYRYRVKCRFAGRQGHIVLDQVRMADATRVARRVGQVAPATMREALACLREMFEE